MNIALADTVRPPPLPAWMLPKQCSCGALYTPGEWLELNYVGLQDDADGGWLELRKCHACGSTMAVAK